MKFFYILIIAVALAPASTFSKQASPIEPQTFVIVHGATGGGWDWKTVAQLLTAQGHTVYRPTLTGLGARHHLANEEIDLDTHIADVVNLILFEELDNVILAGHSYGGMVISGVMNSIPERLKHVIFLDAAVPDDGMSAIEAFDIDQSELKTKNGLIMFEWLDDSKPVPRDVPQPLNSFTQALKFDSTKSLKIDTTYVAFVPPDSSAQERAKDPSWQRAKQRGWSIRTFPGDHVVYREKPVEFVELLSDVIDEKTNR